MNEQPPSADADTRHADSGGPAGVVGRGRWRLFGLLLLLCLAAGLLEAIQVRSGSVVRGDPMTWGRALTAVIPYWVTLAALLPPVVWLAFRYPLGAERWRRNLGVHLLIGAVYAAVHLALASWLADYVLYRDFPLTFSRNLGRLLSVYFTMEVLVYWAIVGAAYAVSYYRRYREREREAARLEVEAARLQAGLAEANLQALRMQLQPHFLFNTLNAVSVLAMKGERQAVVRMLNRLGDLLRLTLDNAAQVIPLREELEFLERYLEIEQVRFADRLEVRMDVPPETLEAEVPSLLLQPLAENAVRHGVAKQPGGGRIEVRARRAGDRLELEVLDSGPGFRPGFQEPSGNGGAGSPREGGVGLANVRARLAQLYPDAHRLVLDAAPGGGAAVRLSIPFRVGAPELEKEPRPEPLAARPA